MITKKELKKIKGGDRDLLMRKIDDLLDYYEEDKFDNGYKSCMDDMSVRAYRLAEYLHEKSKKEGVRAQGEKDVFWMGVNQTAEVIEEYFSNALNK